MELFALFQPYQPYRTALFLTPKLKHVLFTTTAKN